MTPARRRVLVAGGRFGSLSPWEAGVAVAQGLADRAEVAVVPIAAGGPDLGRCLVALRGGELIEDGDGWRARGDGWLAIGAASTPTAPGLHPEASSFAFGQRLAQELSQRRVGEVVLDLTEVDCHDAGAGLLAALGATADRPLDAGAPSLRGLREIDLDPVLTRLAGATMVGVVSRRHRDDRLLGLRGITSRRGHAVGADPALMLAIDAALADFADATAPSQRDAPGAGASGGAGFAVLALGGGLATGTELLAQWAQLDRTLAASALVVAVCDSFDIGHHGGEAVTEIAVMAEAAERPLAVLSGRVDISGRELRTLGIESAQAVDDLDGGPAPALCHAAQRLAASWQL